jgi:hypothetical protein
MGWFGVAGKSRKELINELVAPYERKIENEYFRYITLRHCYRGNAFSGVLWSLVEKCSVINEFQLLTSKYQFIRCDVIQRRGDEWWYKPIFEADHPYYYSCPKKYLSLTAATPAQLRCELWRKRVREYHADAEQRRLSKRRLALTY